MNNNGSKFNLTDYCLTDAYEEHPEKIALIIVNNINESQNVTYKKFYEDIAGCCKTLQDIQIPLQTTMLIHSIKSYEFLVIYFAAIAAGLVVITSLESLTDREIKAILEESKAKLYYRSIHIKGSLELDNDIKVLNEKTLKRWIQPNVNELSFKTKKRDPAFIIFTSGSSSKPKGVVHAQDVVLARQLIRQYWLDLTASDRVLVTGRPCWTYSMGVGFLDTFASSATSVIYNGEESDIIWYELVEKYKVTVFASSPIYYKKLLTVDAMNYNLSSLRIATSAGEALPFEVIEYWKKYINIDIYEALGMTEISTFISSGPTVPIKQGYIGKVQPGRNVTILSIERNGEYATSNEVGLLAIHKECPGFMLGYLQEEDNRNANFRGSWFVSGDLVSEDEDRYIKCYGRYDNVLNIRGGHRVSPTEIESILIKHPDIKDVACGITTDENDDNILTAFIVSEKSPEELDLTSFASQRLSINKVPERTIILPALPRNINGKIDRKKLREL